MLLTALSFVIERYSRHITNREEFFEFMKGKGADKMDFLGVILLAVTSAGLVTAIAELIRHRNAEKALVAAIKRDQAQDERQWRS
jgi:hypothetical protein